MEYLVMALHQCLGFDYGLLVDVLDLLAGFIAVRNQLRKVSNSSLIRVQFS
jgi:hypothetical protein